MARLGMVSPEQAPDDVKKFYDAAEKQIGMVPNIFKVMANSPAALGGLMGLLGALGGGKLPPELRERICVAVAYFNKCHY